MGINLDYLQFFDICFKNNALQGPILALGNQEIHETEKAINNFALANSYDSLAKDNTVKSLMKDRYGITEYHDCDINGKADFDYDLGMELPKETCNAWMTVIDGGTIEHIFNAGLAFKNTHNLVKPGGTIIHLSPLTWFNHGFYNFNPKLFHGLINANKYALLTEAFYVNNKLHVIYDVNNTNNSIKQIINGASQPCNLLYLIAYRKITKNVFKSPIDISF